MGAAYGQQLAYDLGGGVNDKSTLLAYRDEHLSDARNILGNQEVSASFLYSHVNGLRNLADFGLTAAEEYQLADSLWRSYTANSMYRKLTKKSGLGSIVKVVASSVISFAATSVLGPIGGALVSTLASGGDLGGFGSALVGGAVGAFIGSGVSQAFGEAIKTTGGQFAASVLGGGITAEVLGGDFASGALGGAIGFGLSQLRGAAKSSNNGKTTESQDGFVKASLGGGESLSLDQAEIVLEKFYPGSNVSEHFNQSQVTHASEILNLAVSESRNFSMIDRVAVLAAGGSATTLSRFLAPAAAGVGVDASTGGVSAWKVFFGFQSKSNPLIYDTVVKTIGWLTRHKFENIVQGRGA